MNKAETSARFLYEKVYCARGEMENRIKECQGDLFADRTSTATLGANQLRLWLASFAYALPSPLRRIGLAHTQFAEATCGTIRLKILKLAGLSASARSTSIALASAVPTPTNGGWPPPASSQPPDASPRRRKNAAIQPTAHREPPTQDPPHRANRARIRSSSHSHCAIIVGAKTKPLL